MIIYSLTGLVDPNNPVTRQQIVVAVISRVNVIFASKNDIETNCHLRSIDFLDHHGPNPATWLNLFCPALFPHASDYQLRQYHAYCKSSLIKIIDILNKNSVLRARDCYKDKLRANCLKIFI